MSDSLWLPVAVVAVVLITAHTLAVSRHLPWIPGLAALAALVQWVLAPWAAYHLPPITPAFTMPLPPDPYFAYAVPAALAWAIGLYLPLVIERGVGGVWSTVSSSRCVAVGGPGGARSAGGEAPPQSTKFLSPLPGHGEGGRGRGSQRALRVTCDLMVLGGLIASAAIAHGVPAALDYAVRLVADLAFVGAFALWIARAPGWWIRVALVLGARAVLASADGMFHDVLIWAGYCCAMAAFVYHLRPVVLLGLMAAAVVMLGAVNEIKSDYRSQIASNPDFSLSDRAQLLGRTLTTQLRDPLAPFEGESRARTVARLNQGWIIGHTLLWVPANEPYAEGETLETAVENAVVPRIVRTTKYEAGGSTYFERFTGMPLPHATSMNLSIAGEMYANFGIAGGLAATFAFATLIGLIFRTFVHLARRSPLWYAWAPYVLLYAVQAENGLGEEVNQISKAILITAVCVAVLPAWDMLRRNRLPVSSGLPVPA